MHMRVPECMRVCTRVRNNFFVLLFQQHQAAPAEKDSEAYEYDLVGVLVHTGTADSGHYYSFIKERNTKNVSDGT